MSCRDVDADDVLIQDDGDGSVLTTKVLQSDVVYSCQAVNEAGSSGRQSCRVSTVQPGTRAL